MDAVSATTASTTPPSASTTTTTSKATDPKKSFSALFTEAKHDLKKGETLTKVDGHPFARIKGGTRDDMCINLSGNARSGRAFDLISRGGHEFHVYGTGKDRTIVEVGKPAAATDKTPSTSTTTDTTSGGSTTPATGSSTTTTTPETTSSSGGSS